MEYQYKQGFLGQEFNKISQKIKQNYKEELSLLREVNRFAHNLYYKLNGKIKNTDHAGIILATLYTKALYSYQAIVLLAEKGMYKECNIILRTLIEATFWISLINKDNNFSIKYNLRGEYEGIKLLKKLLQDNSWNDLWGGSGEINRKLRDKQTEYDQLLTDHNIEQKDINELTILNLAKLSGLFKSNYIIYSLLSSDIHSNANSLNDLFDVNSANEIKNIIYGPQSKYIGQILITNISCFLEILKSINNYFSMNEEKSIQDYSDKYLKISNTMENKP